MCIAATTPQGVVSVRGNARWGGRVEEVASRLRVTSEPDSSEAAPAPTALATVRIHRPAPSLQPYVTFFYFVEATAPLSDFLYPEWGNVRIPLSGDWTVEVPGFPANDPRGPALFGPTDRHGRIRTGGGRAVGFGMTPIGWHRLIHGPADRLANRAEPLGDRLGVDAAALTAALRGDGDDATSVARLEALLVRLVEGMPPVRPLVLAVDRALRSRPATVQAFAADAGLTERTLQRVCLATFGFAPKRLLRLQRFLDTLGHVRAAVGGRVTGSLADDYYDAAHFYRDFRDFMAMSPRAYFHAKRPLMGPAAAAQMAAGVTLSFRLPPQPGEAPAEAEYKPR